MNISYRMREIIKILVENKDRYITLKYISKKLNVSEKTIYRDLKIFEFNEYFYIEKIKSKGIRIINKNNINDIELNNIFIEKYSVDYRRLDIYYNLLITSPKNTNLLELSNKYYVGQTSIINDLKYIEENLMYKGLILIKDKYGTRIEGNENIIRKAILIVLLKFKTENKIYLNNESRLDIGTYTELSNKFSEKNVNKIEKYICDLEEKLEYKFGDVYYINICTHILILIQRIKNNNLKIHLEQLSINDKKLFELAKELVKKIDDEFLISVPDNEVFNIYTYLCSSGKVNIDHIDENFEEIFKEENFISFITKLKHKLNLDISLNTHIYFNFLLHIKSLINRLKFDIDINNPLLYHIKENFKSLYFNIKEVVESLDKENIFSKLNDSEISYIVTYYQLYFESIEKNKNVLIICSSGMGTSQLLKVRIEKRFKNLHIVGVISKNELKKIDISNIDFIISTIHINKLKIPILYVSALLNEDDIKMISEQIGEKI